MAEILKIASVTQRFGGLTALTHVDLHVDSGEIVGIIGPNGAGKTTLFNCMTGLYRPTEGTITMLGIDVTGWKPHRITALGFSRTFQNIRLFPRMTVLDNVIVGMHTRTASTILGAVFRTRNVRHENRKMESKAEEILTMFNLYQDRYQLATSLPYGQQRELEIARALACEPRLLMLDEPAAGMNEIETENLLNTVRRIRDMGYSILLIEHDMKFIMNICDRIYVLNEGALIGSGTPDEVRGNPAVIEAYLGKDDET